MPTLSLPRSAALATAALAGALLYAANGSVAAKPVTHMKAPASSVSQGKALVAKYRCTGCHGPTLAGQSGFAPSIRKTGAMHDYTKAQFVTLIHTGMKNDGSHVRPPMPVFAKMPTAQAVSIFLYLETLK